MKVLSLISPDDVERLGILRSQAICGTFADDITDPEHFQENTAFVNLLHSVIAHEGATSPQLQEAARRQQEGYVYIIDLRTPEGPMGRVPPEDIIGVFKVKQGRLLPGSYQRNQGHRIFTRNGLFKLPDELLTLLIAALRK